MRKSCPYQTHRVMEPAGLLARPAWKRDSEMIMEDNYNML